MSTSDLDFLLHLPSFGALMKLLINCGCDRNLCQLRHHSDKCLYSPFFFFFFNFMDV